LDEFHSNVTITVYADIFSPETTSDVSAGYWEPYCIGDSPKEKENILKWGKETYDIMLRTALSKDAFRRGVQAQSAYVLQEYDQIQVLD
jgi:D-amino-acid oxidase